MSGWQASGGCASWHTSPHSFSSPSTCAQHACHNGRCRCPWIAANPRVDFPPDTSTLVHRPAMAMLTASSLAVPTVLFLIALCGYSSQLLYPHLDPHPLEKHQAIKFNLLLTALLISFVRACLTDAGRVPKDWVPPPIRVHGEDTPAKAKDEDAPTVRPRWCSKCDAPKPPRTHHCKICGRYCLPATAQK